MLTRNFHLKKKTQRILSKTFIRIKMLKLLQMLEMDTVLSLKSAAGHLAKPSVFAPTLMHCRFRKKQMFLSSLKMTE